MCELVKFVRKLGFAFDVDELAVDDDEYLIQANLSLVHQQTSIDSSPTHLNDDVFVNSEFLRQQHVLLQQRNNLRRRSSLFYKRTGILNELQENKGPGRLAEVAKVDKQTQITTMLCSTFASEQTKSAMAKPQKRNADNDPFRRPSAILECIEDAEDKDSSFR